MGFATEEQASAILAEIKRTDAEREAAMPDTQRALHQAHTAKERLRSLGWRDGIYCPKDGSEFALVEWGSTGVHSGFYTGKWPTGHIYCGDFLMRPEGVMWKAVELLTPDEATALAESKQADREFMDRQIASFVALEGEQ